MVPAPRRFRTTLARTHCSVRRSSVRRAPKIPWGCSRQSLASFLCADNQAESSFVLARSSASKPLATKSLLPFEIRSTLFDICRQALLGVLAGKQQLLQLALQSERFGKGYLGSGHNRPFDAAHRS